jgi:hypothetical protein
MNIEDLIYAASTAATWGPRIIYRAAEDRNRGVFTALRLEKCIKKPQGLPS